MKNEEREFLENYHIEDYDRPSIAADIAAFAIMRITEEENFRKNRGKKLKLLMVKRGTHPFKGCYALPGGFVKRNETVLDAAKRELFEETGVKEAAFALNDIFAEKGRDPRGWIISNTYLALLDANECALRADTDAWEAAWFTVELSEDGEPRKGEDGESVQVYSLKLIRDGQMDQNNVGSTEHSVLKAEVEVTTRGGKGLQTREYRVIKAKDFAFDHAKIILSSLLKLRELTLQNDLAAFDLLPEAFTLTELQNVYEQVLDRKLLTANFRRKMIDYVEECDTYVGGEGHRPAQLFRRKVLK